MARPLVAAIVTQVSANGKSRKARKTADIIRAHKQPNARVDGIL
jgi:hypothetical protein